MLLPTWINLAGQRSSIVSDAHARRLYDLGARSECLYGAWLCGAVLGTCRGAQARSVPSAAVTISFLVNPNNPNTEERTTEMQEAVRAVGQRLHVVTASVEAELEPAFATIERRAGALIVPADPFFANQRDHLIALADRYALPASYPFREDAVAGGLMSYGPIRADVFRLVGTYTGRILKGAKPADLPVQQSTKVELVINLKTAKTL